MEFEGKIVKVLPTRSGKRQDGTEWKSLPFVFEYYENPTDRTPDSVLLETTDHEMMRSIGKFVVRGADNKAVVKDGLCEMTGEIWCRCGWSHRAVTYKKKDGSGEGMMNRMWLYKLEVNANAANAAGTVAVAPQQQAIQKQAVQQQEAGVDDLPF